MNLSSFFAELKRRNVYKVAVAYAIVGWLLDQNATQVFPFFEIPNWSVQLIVFARVSRLNSVGLPPSCLLTWWATPRWPSETKHSPSNCWRSIAEFCDQFFRASTARKSKRLATRFWLSSRARWRQPNVRLRFNAPWPNATTMSRQIIASN